MLVQPPVAFQQSTQDAQGTAGDPNRSKQQLEMRERRTQMASVHIAQVGVGLQLDPGSEWLSLADPGDLKGCGRQKLSENNAHFSRKF